MILKTVFVALAGVAVWKFANAKRVARADQPQRALRSENRWEGEGGALHQSGAQLGPQPSVVGQV